MKIYVVARSVKTNRPGCMHICTEEYGEQAACGYDLVGSSRNYTETPLLAILCKRCNLIFKKETK